MPMLILPLQSPVAPARGFPFIEPFHGSGDQQGHVETHNGKEAAMFARTLIASVLSASFLAASFAGVAEAGPKQKISGNQAPQGSMDGWPQTLDELENAYNCGPYADRESAKKCKK
jgi:hypothetical protein